MILQKKTINNVPTLVPLTADTGSGVPVGTVIGQYKKVNMAGYLYLDGSTFDQTLYPALYAYLGTNVLPDYREFVLVGAEQNSTSAVIATHDVFTQGQEKDDQLQDHSHDIYYQYSNVDGTSPAVTKSGNPDVMHSTFAVNSDFRSGTTTRTKEKAVFWYIKATTGIIESEATEMLNVFNNRMFPDYAHPISIPANTTTWTATEDCYVVQYYFTGIDISAAYQRRLTIDGNTVGVADSSADTLSMAMFTGYIKKGQVVSSVGTVLDLSYTNSIRFFPLTN